MTCDFNPPAPCGAGASAAWIIAMFRIHKRDSPELHWSTQDWYRQPCARPLSRDVVLYLGVLCSSFPCILAKEEKGNKTIEFCGNLLCEIGKLTIADTTNDTKIIGWCVTKQPIFPLLTDRFSGSASPRRVVRGSSQYLLPSSPVATYFPALSATIPRRGMEQHSQTQIRLSRAMYAPGCGIVL